MSAPSNAPVDVTDDNTGAAPASGGGMRRNQSWVWDWSSKSPPPSQPGSRNSSQHGGNAFGKGSPTGTPGNSGHGGKLFSSLGTLRRNMSLGNMAAKQEVMARTGEAIAEKDNAKASSLMWVWGQSPPASNPGSRNASAHGGTAFANKFGNEDGSGKATQGRGGEPAVAVTGGGSMRRNSMSFLWNWSKYRDSPPASNPGSRNSSQHGGNAFAADFGGGDFGHPKEGEDEGEEGEAELQPTVEPPKSMKRNMSIGSFMWNWGGNRISPPQSRNSSLHGGTAFEAEATKVVVPK